MKVHITGSPNANSYLQELLNYSRLDHVYGRLEEVANDCAIVLFQWPEELIDWSYPTQIELNNLGRIIIELKVNKKVKMAGFVHNLKPHDYKGKNHDLLFEMIYGCFDLFFHFGNYSKELLSIKYPAAQHVYINHPVYRKTLKVYNQQEARLKLKLLDGEKIILVPGKVRNRDEQMLILKSSRILRRRNVKLVVLQMDMQIIKPRFKGYYTLKWLLKLKYLNKLIINFFKNQNIFLTKRLSNDELSLWLSACDGIWIARKDILNSGVFYLALTYKKPALGPGDGNLKEHLIQYNFPLYSNSKNENLENGFNELLSLIEKDIVIKSNDFEPQKIASIFDYHLDELIKVK